MDKTAKKILEEFDQVPEKEREELLKKLKEKHEASPKKIHYVEEKHENDGWE